MMRTQQDSEVDRDDDAGARDLLLAVSDLHAGYGHVPVLRGVSLELREGEALGIIGHNGMGKTTLLKAIMGLLPATGGRIVIDGVDVTQWAAHERSRLGIGYVPQGRGILPGLTAQENLRLAWTPDSGETEESAIERVVGLLPRLSRLLDRRGGTLSGGEQQILALARALVGSPWLLILDEPSEGIQPSIVEEISAILDVAARPAAALDADRRAEPRAGARCGDPHRAGRARTHHPHARSRGRARRRGRGARRAGRAEQ